MMVAVMARKTRHVLFTVRELGIDLTRHDDHHSRGLFVLFLIAGEIALHVTMIALDPQSDAERAHHRADVFRLEQLEILRRRRRSFLRPILLFAFLLSK